MYSVSAAAHSRNPKKSAKKPCYLGSGTFSGWHTRRCTHQRVLLHGCQHLSFPLKVGKLFNNSLLQGLKFIQPSDGDKKQFCHFNVQLHKVDNPFSTKPTLRQKKISLLNYMGQICSQICHRACE